MPTVNIVSCNKAITAPIANGNSNLNHIYISIDAIATNIAVIPLYTSSLLTVGPTVSNELVYKGITAILVAIASMLIYIWFRFELPFAVGAVIALIHDTILTIGMFALTSLEFNLSTVAAILLIIGYSMNDTVVVYDRIRENLKKFRKVEVFKLLNKSINETLSRTINTTATTIIALLALYYFGGNIIKDFSLAMIWGIIIGTYSSILIATPILLNMKIRKSKGDEE
jgi:preprotein translocase SecF subunit